MRFTTLSLDVADRQRVVEEVEFVPGRPALDIEVGAEAKRMDRRAHHVLDGADAGEIDDGDDLAGDVRKAVARAFEHLRRPLDLAGIGRWRRSSRSCAGLRAVSRSPWATIWPLWLIERTLLASSNWVRRPASHSSRISIRKCGFRQPFRLGRVEAGGAVLDGVAAVGQQRLAGAQFGAAELLRGQAFDGVAVDPGDPGGKGGGRHARLLRDSSPSTPPLPNL